MLYENYNNFDDLFLNINKNIIEQADKYIEFENWNQFYLPFCILETNSCKCSLDLGRFGYTNNKIKMLIKTYIDYEKYETFKKHLYTCKGTSLTLYFKNVKPKQGTTGNNGPCIISMVFTKKYRNDKQFSEVNIYYRTTEINRRFYADLCLFYLIMKEMPSDIVNIEKYRIIIPKAFFHTKTVLFNLDIFNANIDVDNSVTKQIKKHLIKFNSNNPITYKSHDRIRRKMIGELTYEPVILDDLFITDGGLHL